MLVVALALAALMVAAAKPQRTVAVPAERASIMLAIDTSGSMTATDVKPNRLVAAKRAARRFLARVPKRVNVGVVSFSGTARVLQNPTQDRLAAQDVIDSLKPTGGTATGEAMANSLGALRSVPSKSGKRPPGAMVVLSDGASTSGRDPLAVAREAAKQKVPVYTVALGTQGGTITVRKRDGSTQTKAVPPDVTSLADIADAAGGKSFTAKSTAGLNQVYEKLGSQLGRKNVKQQISSTFAGGGLALFLLGAAMSLRWFGRLI
jgi:Ca-activated chloride channel family protein